MCIRDRPETSGNGRYDAYAEIGYHSVASDLDGDGVGEIIAGSSVYRSDGSLVCNVDIDGVIGPDVDGFSAPFLPAETQTLRQLAVVEQPRTANHSC